MIELAPLSHAVEGDDPSRPAVLLLNGGMMTYVAWEPVATVLRRDFRLVRFDFRGQLLSPGTSAPSLEAHADEVVRLLDALGIGSVHLVGTSFGGLVAVLVAASHPGRARSLAAVTVAIRTDEAMTENARELRRLAAECAGGGERTRFHERLLETVYSPSYREGHAEELEIRRQTVDLMPDHWFADLDGIVACVEEFDLAPAAARVTCPSMIVTAADDRMMPVDSARELAAVLPGLDRESAEVVEHPHSGHGMVVEEPIWLAEQCRRFCLEVEKRVEDRG